MSRCDLVELRLRRVVRYPGSPGATSLSIVAVDAALPLLAVEPAEAHGRVFCRVPNAANVLNSKSDQSNAPPSAARSPGKTRRRLDVSRSTRTRFARGPLDDCSECY